MWKLQKIVYILPYRVFNDRLYEINLCLIVIFTFFFIESFTPDHKPLLGEDPVVRGFYHGCGFNSLGMNAGGGCGRELARWVVRGRPELDMYGYDIR